MADANVPLIYLDVLVHHLALLRACTSRPLCNPSITIVFLGEILVRQEQVVQQLCDVGTCCAVRLALSSYLHSRVATGLIRLS